MRDLITPDEIEQAWNLLRQRDMIDVDDRRAGFHVELVRRWTRVHRRLSTVSPLP